MTAAPKPRTLRDKALLAYVRGLPCLVAGQHECRGKVDPHHVRSRGAGGADRNNVVPLCRRAHDLAHREGPGGFRAVYGLDLPIEAERVSLDYLLDHPDAVESPHVRPHRPMPKRRTDRLSERERRVVEEALRAVRGMMATDPPNGCRCGSCVRIGDVRRALLGEGDAP